MIILFWYCFINQREAITFALYNTNWNEMHVSGRKMVLLGMQINETNYARIKYSNTKIVNLKMYASVRIVISNSTNKLFTVHRLIGQ